MNHTCNYKGPYNREAEEDLMTEVEVGDVMMEIRGWSDAKKGS